MFFETARPTDEGFGERWRWKNLYGLVAVKSSDGCWGVNSSARTGGRSNRNVPLMMIVHRSDQSGTSHPPSTRTGSETMGMSSSSSLRKIWTTKSVERGSMTTQIGSR